jgi:hypothetical protein
MDDKPFGLYFYQRRAGSSVHLPPRLNFAGRWVGPNLVMEDEGSTMSAFLVDGSLNLRPRTPGPTRAITFVETRWWFGNPCHAQSGF